MAPRTNLDTTWLPIIKQKAKRIGKPYTDGELKTIAGEFLKRLPQNVDNNTFNEILNKTFTDFDALKAARGAQAQQPQASQERPTGTQQEKQAELTPDQKMELGLKRNFTQDIKAFVHENNLDEKLGDDFDISDISEEVVNRYMFYKKKLGKELNDKQYLRVIQDTVREKLNGSENKEIVSVEQTDRGKEEVKPEETTQEPAETNDQSEETSEEERHENNKRDSLTGLTVEQLCKVGDNLEQIIRKGLKSRFGYLMNLDYKLVRYPDARFALNYDDVIKEFKESWMDSGYGDGFSENEIDKIARSNVIVVYVLKERALSDVVTLIRENPAFRGKSGLAVGSAAIPNMAEVPYTSMNVRFSERDYNGKLIANIGVTVFGGKLRPLFKSGAGFLADIFKMASDLTRGR